MIALDLIDKLLQAISPKRAYEREAWKQGLEMIRNYDAGKYDRLNEGWRPLFNESAEMTDKHFRDTIRARARDLERNSDIANGFISAIVRNVVGKGMSLQVKTPNEELNSQIEKLWQEWCKPMNCDVYGVQTFMEMVQTIVRRRIVDGGILIYKAYTPTGMLPFSIQLIEVDELDGSAIKPFYKENVVVDGVEKASFGNPVGYHIKQYQPDGSPGIKPRFIPSKDMIFYFNKTRPSQTREISSLAQSMTRIRDITSYMEAVAVKERVAACLAVFITRNAPSGTGGFGRATPVRDGKGFGGYGGLSLTPGMIQELQPGDGVEVVEPGNNGSGATEFVRLQQRLGGAGQGLSYETVSRDMSQVNYSSARQGLIEDEMTYSMEQESLIPHVLREIYETFLISAVLAGKLPIPDLFNSNKKWDYMNHVWVPQGRKWIDPLKEASANRIALEKGLKTYPQICLENGVDWKEAIDDIAAAAAYAKEKGVDIFAARK